MVSRPSAETSDSSLYSAFLLRRRGCIQTLNSEGADFRRRQFEGAESGPTLQRTSRFGPGPGLAGTTSSQRRPEGGTQKRWKADHISGGGADDVRAARNQAPSDRGRLASCQPGGIPNRRDSARDGGSPAATEWLRALAGSGARAGRGLVAGWSRAGLRAGRRAPVEGHSWLRPTH